MRNSPDTLRKRQALRRHWAATIDPTSFPHEMDRECRDCHRVRPCKWTSSFTQTGKPEYRNRCNECHNRYLSRNARLNRARRTTQALDRKHLVKVRCVEYLGGKCIACGYDRCIKGLTFHHRDHTLKTFAVGQMLDRAWSILVAELEKCDLLCFNCHMERHCDLDQEIRIGSGHPRTYQCLAH